MPRAALPEVVASWGEVGRTSPEAFLGLDLPVAGIAGDQQAALFGQACFAPGESKCTYGTGSFVLVNTGPDVVRSEAGLLTTVAWQAPSGELTYALEGAIFVTGSAVQWLRDGLGIIGAAAGVRGAGPTVPDSGGVVFVPALTGLGAPDWDPTARGTIVGITRGTTRAHLTRATLEAIAFEVRDVVELLPDVRTLRVDGGAAANDLLLQLQADTLAMPVERPAVARDDRARGGVPGRHRHRGVVVDRRAGRDLAGGRDLRAGAAERGRHHLRAVAAGRGPGEGMGRRLTPVVSAGGPSRTRRVRHLYRVLVTGPPGAARS